MKLVKTAKIGVVTLSQLREGDEILWSNIRCKVLEIDRFKRKVTFVPSSLPLSYHSNPFEGSYLHYYRILECEEISTCTICGKRIEIEDTVVSLGLAKALDHIYTHLNTAWNERKAKIVGNDNAWVFPEDIAKEIHAQVRYMKRTERAWKKKDSDNINRRCKRL
ncbi:MAG: hypothetical protein N2V75_11170 [Methanophagales archaeon]|nr:hypothetical protein [Methanophagales archaeon]